MTAPGILISAGDPSGAMHAARLARALTDRTGARMFGLGTGAMSQAGVELVGDASQIAVIGLSEALELLPRAWRLLNRLEAEAARRRPRLAILVDSPDFNLRLGARLKRLGIPIVYFISPQVWAWRSGRVGRIRQLVERMLVIFPFEEKFYREAGVAAEFIGHPLCDVVKPDAPAGEFRRRWSLDPQQPILALLPGSRPKELAHNLPVMTRAERLLAAAGVPCQPVLAAAPGLAAGDFRSYLGPAPSIRVVEDATYNALAAAECAIVSSGTATVEAALLGAPMVVVYRVSPVSAFLLRRLVHTPFFSMVNLLLERCAVPELIQQDFTPERVAQETRRLLERPEERERMKCALAEVRSRLASPSPLGAIGRAAEIISSLL
ncbi:MAG TPA: lipid-A-disaccharide synthase [Patescibacteria group bacterium]|nr:lipid-A-disaccharide synthase [Patescibacteria group bacterium]